jgi:tetratricopeptide (TPR) repeat protein
MPAVQPASERKLPAAADESDDAKTMIATASPHQIKDIMGGKRPAPAGTHLPAPPPSPGRKASAGNLAPPPKGLTMPPSRSNPLGAPPSPPLSERNLAAARATGANAGLKMGNRAGSSTMKGVAPPSLASSTDEVETGRIKVGEDEDEQTDERTERRDIVKIGDEGLADAEAALEAMTYFQNAETAALKGDWTTAELLAKKAIKGDDSEPSYQVLLAWVQVQAGTLPADDAIRSISKVLIEDPANEKALFYRGRLLTKKNKLREAINDFDELLQANPNHLEAQIEVKALRAKLPP